MLMRLYVNSLSELQNLAISSIRAMLNSMMQAGNISASKVHINLWGNNSNSIFFFHKDMELSLSLPFDSENKFRVYDAKGQHLIASIECPAPDRLFSSYAGVKALEEILDRYARGEVRCSECGIYTSLKEAIDKGHTLYAGVYCPICAGTDLFKNAKVDEGR